MIHSHVQFLHFTNIFESIDRIDLKVFPRYTGSDNEDDGYNDVTTDASSTIQV